MATGTANETSVGQSIPRLQRVSIRFFFFYELLGHRGGLFESSTQQDQWLNRWRCQGCAS